MHSTLRGAPACVRRGLGDSQRRSGRSHRDPEKITTVEPFTADEAREFLHAARDHRLYGLWVTVLMLGLRRSEALGLHWSDVDLDKGMLRISRVYNGPGESCGNCDQDPAVPPDRALAAIRRPGAP